MVARDWRNSRTLSYGWGEGQVTQNITCAAILSNNLKEHLIVIPCIFSVDGGSLLRSHGWSAADHFDFCSYIVCHNNRL